MASTPRNQQTTPPRQAHTPGPWRYDKSGGVLTPKNERLLVNGVACPLGNHPQDAEATANARLIAVAPEMLAALRQAQKFIDTLCATSTLRASKVVTLPSYKQICAVIAKAEAE